MTRRRAADYVPHRPPMLWLDEVGDDADNQITCYATIRPDYVFLDGDHARPVAMIELVAQASAVFLGIRHRRAGRTPRFGMVFGCREAEFFTDRLSVGDELSVSVVRTFDEPEISAFDGVVERAGQVIGRVSLSVIDGEPRDG